MKRIALPLAIILLFIFQACNKADNSTENLQPIAKTALNDLEFDEGEFQIMDLPVGMEYDLNQYFNRCLRMRSSTGVGYHILIEDGVSDEYVYKVKQIFDMLLEEKPDSSFGSKKYMVKRSLAIQNCCFLLFANHENFDAKVKTFEASQLNYGACIIEETYLNGETDFIEHNRHDKAYKDVFSFIVKYGIKQGSPTFYEKILRTTVDAITSHKYIPHPELNLDECASEYFSILMDVYYGNWNYLSMDEHFEKYLYTSRFAMINNDQKGAELISDFLNPQINILNVITPGFLGSLSLQDISSYPYTNKTQFWNNVQLTGNSNSNVYGNDRDNLLIGNSGNNLFKSFSGDDIIDGAEGFDKVLFDYDSDQTIIEFHNDTVLLFNSNYGNDILIHVEQLVFENETIDVMN
ncbi:MAG: calcium-binding protein [Bacteroidales bacterium]|nr:calcium-binding protein [Bacteroidales bacterium]